MRQELFLQIRIAYIIGDDFPHIVVRYHPIGAVTCDLDKDNGAIAVFQIPIMLKEIILAILPDILIRRKILQSQHCHADVIVCADLLQLVLQALSFISRHCASLIMNQWKIRIAVAFTTLCRQGC